MHQVLQGRKSDDTDEISGASVSDSSKTPHPLSDPVRFISVLEQHAQSSIATGLLHPEQLTPKEWIDHLYTIEVAIRRGEEEYGDKDNAWGVIMGHTAEFAMSRLIGDMLKNATEVPRTVMPVLRRWPREDVSLALGDRYVLESAYPYNVFLMREDENGGKTCLEEDDMTVWTGGDALSFIDVTLSKHAFKYKIDDERKGSRFEEFRRRMQDLFDETNGEIGRKNIAKILIFCNDSANGSSNLEEPREGVYAAPFPIRNEIILLARETKRRLDNLLPMYS